jgi:hypothetical protein
MKPGGIAHEVKSAPDEARLPFVELSELRTENKRLRKALNDIACEIPGKLPSGWVGECFESIRDIVNENRGQQ